VATRLVALLRGINVGRNKRVAMSELRALLADLGYVDVKTRLQSGNAVFTSASADTAAVAANIERALARELKVESTVIVRTSAELAAVVAGSPLRDVATDPSKYLVGFLAGTPDPAGLRALGSLEVAPNQVRVDGREVYLWCPAGVIHSPFSTVNWDKQLGVPVTMRNWRTVSRLAELASPDDLP
jgi:uncharacterized protein (DUF1697 family)